MAFDRDLSGSYTVELIHHIVVWGRGASVKMAISIWLLTSAGNRTFLWFY